MNKDYLIKKLKQYSLIAWGVILLNLGYFFFINQSKIILGGMMGLATIFEPYYTKINPWFTSSIFILIGNIIVLIIGGIILGKDFFLKTIFASLFSPLVLFILEHLADPNFFIKSVSSGGYYIIALVCGVLLEGFGLGIALKHNGSTGGLDIIQKIMSKYLHIPHSKTMYFTDWVIVVFSGLSFKNGFAYNIEMVVYGLIGVFIVSYLVDMLVLNAKMRRTAYIVTNHPEEIKKCIYEEIDRGVTFIKAYGGYTGEEKTMVVCTMEKNEAYKITELLKEIDPEAFCYVSSTKEIVGEYFSNGSIKDNNN